METWEIKQGVWLVEIRCRVQEKGPYVPSAIRIDISSKIPCAFCLSTEIGFVFHGLMVCVDCAQHMADFIQFCIVNHLESCIISPKVRLKRWWAW